MSEATVRMRLTRDLIGCCPGEVTRPVSGGRELATTFEKVQSIIADRLGVDPDKVTEDADFIADLNADSLDLVEVIMALEQEFDVEIPDEEAEKIRTVGDAVRHLNEHLEN